MPKLHPNKPIPYPKIRTLKLVVIYRGASTASNLLNCLLFSRDTSMESISKKTKLQVGVTETSSPHSVNSRA